MKNFIALFANRSQVVVGTLIVLILWGYTAYVNIARESSPDVDLAVISISASQSGVSAEDARSLIARPLEKGLKTLEKVKKITSYSREGGVSIIVEFEADSDTNTVLQKVRSKVDDVRPDLPKDLDSPTIREHNLGLFPVLNIILSGEVPYGALLQKAKDLKDELDAIPSILNANIRGERQEIIAITFERKVLENYGIPLSVVSKILTNNNLLLPAGSIKLGTGEYQIKLPGIIKDYKELEGFPVKVSGDKVVRLGDVANIQRTYKDRANYVRVNGKPAITISVQKRRGANIISTVEQARATVNELLKDWPKEIEVTYSQDDSDDITESVRELENSLIISAILVSVVIMLAIGGKAALLVALSLPFSFLACVLYIYMMGFSLNMIVLFSLILAVGLVVDDAIVIGEYADRKMVEGVQTKEAFINSGSRMFWPVLTSTLVKIIVFAPLLFWPGVTGEIMKFMPITVITILTASLIYALFVQPAIAPMFMKRADAKDVVQNSYSKLNQNYMKILGAVLSYPKSFVISVFGILCGVYAFFIMYGTGIEFFPSIEPSNGAIVVRASGDLSLKQKDELVRQVEKHALKMKDEIRVINAMSGEVYGNLPSDTIGTINLEFQDWRVRRRADEILKDIRNSAQDVKGIKLETRKDQEGPPSGKPISIEFYGHNIKVIEPLISNLNKMMAGSGQYKDISDTMSVPGIEWHLVVDREKAARYNVDQYSLSQTVQLLTGGLKISSYRPKDRDEELDILLRLPYHDISLDTLEGLKVVNSQGNAIPITNFVTTQSAPKVDEIMGIDGKEVIVLNADVEEGVNSAEKIRELRAWLKENKTQGVSYKFRGDEENISEAGNFLFKAFLTGIALMAMVMLIQFNSAYHTFVVMSAVFFSTVGVLLGLIITWQPFGIVMCGIGVIALAGIVLNNNIIFVDTYQKTRARGMGTKQALILTGQKRLRPILLTAITAILGLLPMVLRVNIDILGQDITYNAPSSQWWAQLSTSIAGGLFFATILTLFFTPALLMLGERFEEQKAPKK